MTAAAVVDRRTVRVRTEVAALDKAFDYTVPDGWTDDVVVGTRVRVPLHGRRVRGWVVDEHARAPRGVELLPLASWLGWGPPGAVVELAEWASWRWAGPPSFFLQAASAPSIVRSLPVPPPAPAGPPPREPVDEPTPAGRLWAEMRRHEGTHTRAHEGAHAGATMLRLPPTVDLLDVILAAADDAATAEDGGSVLVLVPSAGWAERLTERLMRRGRAATTAWSEARAGWPIAVGSRAGAWAPLPRLAAVVVLDAHDEAYREERAPTYSAVDVALERARRAGVRCVLTSPVPPATRAGLVTVALTPAHERAGWAALEQVDRRGADPRTGLFSDRFVGLARTVLDEPGVLTRRGPLVCVYNRTGGARLLACVACGELARCARCGAAAAKAAEEDRLRCPRCGAERPQVCAACGRLRMKTLRAGVSRLREELAALLGTDVGEVAGARRGREMPVPPTPVLVGTEAVLHRVRRAAAVAFLDIDLHLLAPRLSAAEETLSLFVRSARLVGPRGSGPPSARVQVQTRVPDHPVLAAVARGEPAAVLDEELSVRRASALPPFAALARVSGTLAAAYAGALTAALTAGSALSVSALNDGAFLVHAPDHGALCDLMARVERPPGRGLRVEVDPSHV